MRPTSGERRHRLRRRSDVTRARLLCVVVMFAILVSACGSTSSGRPSTGQNEPTAPSKTLVAVTRAEPPSLNPKPFRQLGLTADLSGRMFNAGLTIRNDQGQPTPYLAQTVPELNTDGWRVSADGTMETTYHLKPG